MQLQEVGDNISPLLQMREARLKEVKVTDKDTKLVSD